MPLTLFMAVCILGCDVLIYFLFQWTLGEKGRTKRRRSGSKRRLAVGQETELVVVRGSDLGASSRPKVLEYPKSEPWRRALRKSSDHIEEIAYRKLVAASASSAQKPKLAV